MKQIKCNDNWERILGEKPTALSLTKNPPVTVQLPDDYIINMHRSADSVSGAASGFFPAGKAFYTKRFTAPAEWEGQTILLDIDGAYMNAEVTVNGDMMGVHPYGYTPWQIDLSHILIPGEENEIEILTRCVQPDSRWYSGGGLYRQVSFWVGCPCHIRPWDAFFTTPETSEACSTLKLQATLTNTSDESAQGTLLLSCQGEQRSIPVSVPANGTADVTAELPVHDITLWSDETPALYDAVITLDTNLGTDAMTTKVGFRTIEIDAEHGMRINGRPIKLLGGCLHHDNAMLGAAAYPRAEERKLQLLKDAGYNAVRCAHNPPSQSFLDACDRLGIFVMDEAFDCWKVGKRDLDYHLYYEKWWKDDMRSMMERDKNHPCIFCWSIGNEVVEMGGSCNGEAIAEEMADFARSLDPTRPITVGVHSMVRSQRKIGQPVRTPFQNPNQDQKKQDAPKESPEEMKARMMKMMADPRALEMMMNNITTNNMGDGFIDGEDVWGDMTEASISHLDLAGYNYFHTRYEKDHKRFPQRVICATETRPSDTYECYQAMMENDHVIGDFIWTCYDNIGEAGAGRVIHSIPEMATGMLGPWPWLSCYQGDLDLDGNRRPQSYFRKIMWGKDDGVHVFAKDPKYAHLKPYGLGWQWNDVFASWTWGEENIGKEIYVEAYGDCDEIEFVVNDTSYGKVPVEKLASSAIVTYEPGTLKAIAYKDGVAVAEDLLQTAGAPAAIVLTPDRDTIASDGMDLSFIKATVVDANGITVPTDTLELSAVVSGGMLAGFGSGNPCTEEDYGTGKRKVWKGNALLAVCQDPASGSDTITVTVTAEGMEAANITISCK